MSRRFISAVLAVSMSITAIVPLTATPVAADSTRLDRRNDDAAKLIMGAAAIAILGAAIANKTKQDEKREKDRKKDKERREAERHKPRYEHPRRGIQLSQRCIVDQRGRGDAYDADCLARQGVRVRDLPGQCRVALRSRYGNALGFDARCIDRFSNHGRGWQSGWQQNERYGATPYLPRHYLGN